MRRLGVLLLVVAVLAALSALADGAARRVAQDRVAAQLQTSENLQRRPDVTIEGFPFLLAAWRGEFDQVTVNSAAVTGEGVELQDVEARLTGVRVPVREALGGAAVTVRADRVSVEALIDYPSVTSVLRTRADRLAAEGRGGVQDLAVAAGPDGTVQVQVSVEVLGVAVDLVLPLRVQVVAGDLVLEAVPNGNPAATQAAGLISARVTVPPLPYGLTVTDVRPTPDGLTLEAAGRDVTISS